VGSMRPCEWNVAQSFGGTWSGRRAREANIRGWDDMEQLDLGPRLRLCHVSKTTDDDRNPGCRTIRCVLLVTSTLPSPSSTLPVGHHTMD
jgi:hypothetical protein